MQSKLISVTVFPRGAEINRRLDISLEAGTYTLVVNDLPAGVVASSIRVEGEADGKLEISSVDTRRLVVRAASQAGPDATERKRIEKEIEALGDQIKTQQLSIEQAGVQKELAQNLAKTPLSNWRKDAQQPESAAMPDWNGLFDLIGARLGKIHASIQEAEIRKRELEEKVSVLQQRLQLQPVEETERTELTVHVEAAEALRGLLKIRYQVNTASWTPYYDARLTTGVKGGDASLALSRRAEVSQSTGEDWDDVELTLSTTRPGGATAAPELPAQKVEFKVSGMAAATRMRSPGGGGGADSGMELARKSMAAADEPLPAAPPAPQKISESGASAENTPFQAVFRVPGRASIKSGVGSRKLFVQTEVMKPALSIFAVPRKDPTAYLSVRFTHAGEAPLLAGTVALYRDGVYIGQGALPVVVKGEERELGFGADDAVKVKRTETKRAKSESGLIAASTIDTHQYRITARNLHSWPAPVTIIDQHPYSEDEKITVTLLPDTTEPTVRNRDDKRGVLAWTFEVKPGEEHEITLAYEIRWPAKWEVHTTETSR